MTALLCTASQPFISSSRAFALATDQVVDDEAGFLSDTDHHIWRLLDHPESIKQASACFSRRRSREGVAGSHRSDVARKRRIVAPRDHR